MLVSVGDIKLFFEVEGFKTRFDTAHFREAPTILCLHGGPGVDHSTLRSFLSPLAEVAQLIYLDHRGNGRSDRSAPDKWNLDTWAQDIEHFCIALGIESPLVFGHSFGAAVALAHAVSFPDRPAALILSGTSGRIHRDAVAVVFEQLGGTPAADAFRAHYDAPSDDEASQGFDELCLPLYLSGGSDTAFLQRVISNDAVRSHYTTNEAFSFDFHEVVSEIRCPTLITAGSADPFCPGEELRTFAAKFTSAAADLVIFDGSGHAPYRDDTQRFLQVTREFVASST